MARLKLPAYAKQILLERRAGRHPEAITLVYGEQWWGAKPCICIKADDYEPGVFDFRVVAGVRVNLHDQDLAMMHEEDDKFFDLLVELVRSDCALCIVPPKASCIDPLWVDTLAHLRRVRAKRKLQWPRWWSDALREQHQRSCDGWMRDRLDAILERERGRAA